MAKRSWNEDVSKKRIATRLAEVENVEIREYVRDTDLAGLKNGLAYRVDGVHLYIDILNIKEMLEYTAFEGERCHRRTLRFLNNHYRAVRNILLDVGAIQVDFHNQRLHAVFAKPYGDEAARLHKAVATAKLIRDVLKKTGEEGDEPLPAAVTRVGIDSGKALAVNNGRRSSREPLFLGNPANQAAKRAGGGAAEGIYLTNNARKAVGWDEVENVDATKLTDAQVAKSEEKAKLSLTVDAVVKDWKADLAKNPIGVFEFSRHTPPFQDLDLELLTPKNSRRQESASVYADIDNFTVYVADRIDSDEDSVHVVKALHVLRSELDAVMHDDFAGKKIRFIGDCLHGLLVEGTALTTDDGETSKQTIRCAAALRSGFNVALSELKDAGVDTGDLGLQIGAEQGITSVTRLGIKGEMIRCCISRSVLTSEDEQRRCKGRQTALGPTIYKHAPQSFRDLFGTERICDDFDYAAAEEALKPKEDAQKASSLNGGLLKPATAAASGFAFGSVAAQPSRTPAGFA